MYYANQDQYSGANLLQQSATMQGEYEYQGIVQPETEHSRSSRDTNPYAGLGPTELPIGYAWVANYIENIVSDGDFYIGQELL
jgi:hypothetical protein